MGALAVILTRRTNTDIGSGDKLHMPASMLSLQANINELDRQDAVSLSRVRNAYGAALESLAEYAIGFDEEELAKFQQHVASIKSLWEKSQSDADLEITESSLRGELRSYSAAAQKRLQEMKTELNSAITGLQNLCVGVEENGSKCQEVLVRELGNLGSASESDDIAYLRKQISESRDMISASWEQMQKANAMMVAQLRDEIRSLHRELADQRRAMLEDKVSGAWSRAKIDSRIEDLIRANEGFCVAVIWLSNLKRLTATCPQPVIAEALRAFVLRFKNTVGDSLLGRFSAEEFAAAPPQAVEPLGAAPSGAVGQALRRRPGHRRCAARAPPAPDIFHPE